MLEADLNKQIGDLLIDARISAPVGVTVLFGPSGAGKSTILRMIAGLVEPDAGEISISGNRLFGANTNVPTRNRGTGLVFQDGLLFPHMTVEENLKFAASAGEDIGEVTDKLEIRSLLGRRPLTLSGGERQRVAIARALLGNPGCLLMDEPLASLDQQRKNTILPHLKRLKDTAGIPVLYVTHSVEEAFRLADRIILVDRGRTGLAGTPAEVFGTIPDGADINPLAGGLLNGTILRHHPEEHLTEVGVAGTSIFVAGTDRKTGTFVRIRLNSSDISIARELPNAISILNKLPARVSSLVDRGAQGVGVSLVLDDDQKIVASVTTRAATALGLAVGSQVFALFKTVSVTPENLD